MSVNEGRRALRRHSLPLLGVAAFVLTPVGLSGVGDAPAPHEPAESVAVHFQAVADAVLASAPAGMLGAVALGAFMVALATRLHRAGEVRAAALVITGGALAAGYLLFVHVVYASLAYLVAGTSPDVAKGMFVTTIVATALYGLGATLAVGGAAYGAAQAGLLPRWWSLVSSVGAAVAAVALVSYSDSGFFSPDVQQQVVAGVLQLWLLLTAVALFGKVPSSAGVGRPSTLARDGRTTLSFSQFQTGGS
jgi:hypothetical protein